MTVETDAQNRVESKQTLRQEDKLTLSWVLIGGLAGVAGVIAYALSVSGVLGVMPTYYFGMAFGPLISIAFIGFYYFFRAYKLSPALQMTTLFGIIAGTIVNLMIVVQGAQRIAVPLAARESIGAAWEAANMVQLGLDVSWDIYLSLATILLASVMWGHPRFHKVIALITGLLGAGLLIFNLWTFPIPPGEAGLVDIGPVVGAWYLVITLLVLGSRRWLAEQLANPEPAGI